MKWFCLLFAALFAGLAALLDGDLARETMLWAIFTMLGAVFARLEEKK